MSPPIPPHVNDVAMSLKGGKAEPFSNVAPAPVPCRRHRWRHVGALKRCRPPSRIKSTTSLATCRDPVFMSLKGYGRHLWRLRRCLTPSQSMSTTSVATCGGPGAMSPTLPSHVDDVASDIQRPDFHVAKRVCVTYDATFTCR